MKCLLFFVIPQVRACFHVMSAFYRSLGFIYIYILYPYTDTLVVLVNRFLESLRVFGKKLVRKQFMLISAFDLNENIHCSWYVKRTTFVTVKWSHAFIEMKENRARLERRSNAQASVIYHHSWFLSDKGKTKPLVQTKKIPQYCLKRGNKKVVKILHHCLLKVFSLQKMISFRHFTTSAFYMKHLKCVSLYKPKLVSFFQIS